jgi:large conductance mechanosensitive channel
MLAATVWRRTPRLLKGEAMKKFLSEFRDFIARGNVIDLAVGIIIGSAFTAIVNSLVTDLVTPIIAIFTSGVAFESLQIPLGDGGNAIMIGSFINAVIQFLIIAIVVFVLVKAVNKVHDLAPKKPAEEVKKPRVCPYCKQEIADDATRCPHCTSQLDGDEASA